MSTSPVPPPKPPRRADSISPPPVPLASPASGTVTNNPAAGFRRASKVEDPATAPSSSPPPPPKLPPPPKPTHAISSPISASALVVLPRRISLQSSDSRESDFTDDSGRSSISKPKSKSIFSLPITSSRSAARSPHPSSKDESIILQGVLSKRNREGTFEKCQFVLTKDEVKYGRLPMTGPAEEVVLEEANLRSIPLEAVAIFLAEKADYANCVKRERTFRFMSKMKSFLLKAKTVEDQEQWVEAISTAAAARRIELSIPQPSADELSPVWTAPEINQCQLCGKKFGIFHKKHHCRNCGKGMCEACGTEKVRLLKLDPRHLFKVCNPCAVDVKANRQYGAATVPSNA